MSYNIREFQLPVKIDDFFSLFWHQSGWYEEFMRTSLKDINIYIGEWKEHEDKSLVRDIKSDHPSKVSFPGLPSHATSMKIQKIQIDHGNKKLTIIESNNFEGIPYSDYFRVDTVWRAEEVVSMFMGSSERCTRIVITGEVVFVKSTWLRGSIESNTKSELQDVYYSWETEALKHIKSQLNLSDMIPAQQGVVTNVQLPPLFGDDNSVLSRSPSKLSRANSIASNLSSEDGFYDCEEGGESADAGADEGYYMHSTTDETYALLRDVRLRQQQLRSHRNLPSSHRFTDSRHQQQPYSTPRRGGSASAGGELCSHGVSVLSPLESPIHLLTPKQLMELYGTAASSSSSSSIVNRRPRGGSGDGVGMTYGEDILVEAEDDKPMSRVVVITCAEVLYVLAESSFWQIYSMYRFDLRDLFTVEPVEVLQRMVNSFIPGRHASLLVAPDLYGPAVAVTALPQVLLLAMDASHHGCSRSYLLGDAVVMSLCVWAGLSIIYRLFAFLVAPSITIKHSLCLTGYSMIAWNVALLGSHALDVYDSTIHVPPKYSLILFGIPTAIAQGYVFWEYTPLSLNRDHLPESLRRLASRHRHLTERLLWAVPKLVVLVIIAVTHYQFLWYIARVFLPGRKHFCRLSALMNPANYADILSQKELRQFTINVLRKGVHSNS